VPLCGGEGGSAILGDGRVGGDSARVLGEEVEVSCRYWGYQGIPLKSVQPSIRNRNISDCDTYF